MKLFGHPVSTCTRKVLTTLHEKGQNADFVVVDIMKGEQKNPDHLARQPFGQIPAIDDDGFVLYESRAIIRYVDETMGGPKLTPSDPKGRALMEQWMSVEASNFTPYAMKVIYQRYFHAFRGLPCDEAIVKEGSEAAGKAVDVMDRQLAKTRFLTGAQFTLADICFMPYVEYLFASRAGEIIESRKNAARWWNEVSTRPSWKAVAGK
jgi:glutathione S-transferase